MTTTNSLTDNLREWIQSELPQLEVPSPKALSFLTQGPAAEELWTFITTRVRTENHVDQTRSNINLSSSDVGLPADEDYETQLKQIGADIMQAEKEISALRAQIRRQADEHSKKQSGHIQDAFNHLFVQDAQASSAEEVRRVISRNIAKLIQNKKETINLKTSLEDCVRAENESKDRDDKTDELKTKDIETIHEQNFSNQTTEHDFKLLEAELRELCANSSSVEVVNRLSKLAEFHKEEEMKEVEKVEKVEKIKKSEQIEKKSEKGKDENAAKLLESYVKDTHLKGFEALCAAEEKYKRTQASVNEELKQKKKELSSEEYESLLKNVMREGEKSFLDFVQKEWEPGMSVETICSSTSTKMKRFDGKTPINDADMKAICTAVSKLCAGNEKLLHEVQKDTSTMMDDMSMKMISELQDKFALIEKWIKELRVILEDEKNGKGKGVEKEEQRPQSSISRNVDRLRKKSVKKILDNSEKDSFKLKSKREAVDETKEKLYEKANDNLLPGITKGQEKAMECREKDAVEVRDELRNYVRTPGFSGSAPMKEDS